MAQKNDQLSAGYKVDKELEAGLLLAPESMAKLAKQPLAPHLVLSIPTRVKLPGMYSNKIVKCRPTILSSCVYKRFLNGNLKMGLELNWGSADSYFTVHSAVSLRVKK